MLGGQGKGPGGEVRAQVGEQPKKGGQRGGQRKKETADLGVGTENRLCNRGNGGGEAGEAGASGDPQPPAPASIFNDSEAPRGSWKREAQARLPSCARREVGCRAEVRRDPR